MEIISFLKVYTLAKFFIYLKINIKHFKLQMIRTDRYFLKDVKTVWRRNLNARNTLMSLILKFYVSS